MLCCVQVLLLLAVLVRTLAIGGSSKRGGSGGLLCGSRWLARACGAFASALTSCSCCRGGDGDGAGAGGSGMGRGASAGSADLGEDAAVQGDEVEYRSLSLQQAGPSG